MQCRKNRHVANTRELHFWWCPLFGKAAHLGQLCLPLSGWFLIFYGLKVIESPFARAAELFSGKRTPKCTWALRGCRFSGAVRTGWTAFHNTNVIVGIFRRPFSILLGSRGEECVCAELRDYGSTVSSLVLLRWRVCTSTTSCSTRGVCKLISSLCYVYGMHQVW